MRIRESTRELLNGENVRYAVVEYQCRECEDTGFVSIFWPGVIGQAIKDPDSVKFWKRCAALCYCDLGEQKLENWIEIQKKKKRKRKPPAIFGSDWWHVNANDPDAKATAATLVKPELF